MGLTEDACRGGAAERAHAPGKDVLAPLPRGTRPTGDRVQLEYLRVIAAHLGITAGRQPGHAGADDQDRFGHVHLVSRQVLDPPKRRPFAEPAASVLCASLAWQTSTSQV